MQKRERFLPRQITRYNYWTFAIASPTPQLMLRATVQRLGEYPEVTWTDRPGCGAAHQHLQQDFQLLLHATPTIWRKEVFPRFRVKLADIRNRQMYALEYYVEHDKEWEQDPEAQRVKKQLSPRQRAAIQELDNATWPERSKRPARLKRTWTSLLKEIAHDQDTFERLCDTPLAADEMSGTPKRIDLSYRNQAIKLLGGGGTFIPPELRSEQLDIHPDESDNPTLATLLNSSGRIDSPSIFEGVDWLKCTSNKERREAMKLTLHWFRHALRNLREYRNRRPKIPWTAECENTCRDIQKKLLTAKF